MRFYWLTVAILCVWRITHLLNAEDGPGELLVRLRRLAGSGFWGGLLDCFFCLSLWTAAPIAVILEAGWKERLLSWPALSAGAIVLERLISREPPPPPAPYREEEKSDALLRKEKG